MDITSGIWCAKRCQILIVEQNTTNLMGRDVLPKLGISLQQTKQQEEQAATASMVQPSYPNPANREPLGHSEVLKIAKANQRKQAKQTRIKPNPNG